MRPHPVRGLGATALAGAVGVALAVLGPVTAAYAEDPTPSSSPSAGAGGDPNLGPATPGEAVCTVGNGLNEITGMVATDKGIYVVQGGDRVQPTSLRIFTMNASNCKTTQKQYNIDPVDPEDLALGSDGSLWSADIGDNGEGGPNRARIAFEKVALSGGGNPVIYRVTYPNGGKFHAAAMLLDKDDVPIILTQGSGKAGIYKPSKDLVPNALANLPELEKVGDFTPDKTGTSNGAGAVGNSLVTGAAKSPDGKKVVIRTRSDAYEFTVGDDGDVVKAITSTEPLVTPLPDEPQGEAITYSADGTKFLTLSTKPEEAGENPKLLSYTPHAPAAVDPGGGNPEENLPEDAGGGQSFLDKLSFSELTRIVAAVGVVGLVLAIAGIIGIRRARRRRREEDEYDDYDDDDDEYDDPPRRRGRGRGREAERGGYGVRDPQYAEYGQYADSYGAAAGGGYDNGYGANGYAAAGYGQPAAEPAGNGYAAAGYGAAGGQGYAGYDAAAAGSYGQYGADQYGQQQQYANYDPYAQPQYGGQYGGEQNYGTGGYGQQQQQQQAQAYGQQYGDYGGYEDDFDPLHDPRRR
jgi:hypothetical protein